jgi:hypothetical protein
MDKALTPQQMLEKTRGIKKYGWSAIYIAAQNMFKITHSNMNFLLTPEVYRDIFIDNPMQLPTVRGIPKEKHIFHMHNMMVGQTLKLDGRYYVVLVVGGIVVGGTTNWLQPQRDRAVAMTLCAHGIGICNMELHPVPEGVDGIFDFSESVRVHIGLN